MRSYLLTVSLCGLLLGLPGTRTQAADQPGKGEKPIRALLVTGGCCHDYARQKLILSRGISARANVVWTVAHQGGATTNTPIPLYDDPNWSKGFDIVIHNECFSDVRDKQFVENIVRPHREGLPAILIHCAMHCYRTGDDQWFEFVGMQSPGHGPHYSYTVDNLLPTHPIMQDFGKTFIAPKGELYHSIRLFDTATALGQANRQSDKEPQTCIWTNQYGKGRVFATTIGHYNETMAEPKYLDMLTRGLLWACDRDVEASFTPSTEKIDEEIRSLINVEVAATGGKSSSQLPLKCCGEDNLAMGGTASASSEETGKKNFAKNAIDGDLRTRWCANGGAKGQTWQVDLGEAKEIQSLRIHWEKDNTAYQYKIDASANGEDWKTIVDAETNEKKRQIIPHVVNSPETRHLRVTFLGASTGVWGSFWELEAYSTKELPELPKSLTPQAGSTNASISDVEAPDGFNVTLFGNPPEVNYPVCLAAAPTGELFVGVDEQGSLGKEAGHGKVLRCIDTDGDGKADRINEFAKMDHPRGLFYDNGSLWVLHPPTLSVFHDDDLDGVADRQETLITGISTDEVNKRGADHTTNGIRLGIDGWIYIAVGDFGFTEAKAADGTVLSRRGGGIVRIRPDGSEMEIHNWGQRNILDVCIDPFMNVFTRDNTNDGGGWDIRLSHLHQSGEYGYPSLYLNFTEESMPPLADFGGGSGCGGMFLHDLRWPEMFGNTLYTCDWGRSEVYRHNLPQNGATFDAHQEVFLKIPRPTDIDIDGSGRMYVSSWKNGKFAYDGPDVGFVAQVTPIDFTPKPFPDLNAASDEELVGYLASPSAVYRQHSQLAILRREVSESRIQALTTLAADSSIPTYGRVAAIYTLKQLAGADATTPLLKLAQDENVREFTLRALTDRKAGLETLPLEPFVKALSDENPRIRAQALICLGRIGRSEAAEAILPLTKRASNLPKPTEEPLYKQPDPGRVIPHLAVRALQNSNAVEACLKAIDGPNSDGALWALRSMHHERAVSGLFGRLSQVRTPATRQEILTTLIRLYFKEGDYKGGWWGTRPDRTGPYYDRQKWSESDRIAAAIKVALTESDPKVTAHIQEQLQRHLVKLDGTSDTSRTATAEPEKAIVLPKIDPNNPNQIANLEFATTLKRALATTGNLEKGKVLFMNSACVNCHTYANGQNPKGPHLVDIGKRYKPEELLESIVDPSKKIAQGFDTFKIYMLDGTEHTGFIVQESAETVIIRRADGLSRELLQDEIDERLKLETSMMPKGIAGHLTPEELADLMSYLQSLH
jgi:putative heme-binding domain-containing protein